MDIVAAEYARTVGIILYALPPHTTHLLQPLDCSFFAPLKTAYAKSVQYYLSPFPGNKFGLGPQISGANFPRVFMKAWREAAKPATAKSGFRKTGQFPRDPAAIDRDKLNESRIPVQQLLPTSEQPQPPPMPSVSYLLGKYLSSQKSLQYMESFVDANLLGFYS